MSKGERKKLVDKGRRWFLKYLKAITDGAMSEDARSMIIPAALKVYAREMKTNEEFFVVVEKFCSEIRHAEEKQVFFNNMMSLFTENGKLKEELARRFPDEYSVGR